MNVWEHPPPTAYCPSRHHRGTVCAFAGVPLIALTFAHHIRLHPRTLTLRLQHIISFAPWNLEQLLLNHLHLITITSVIITLNSLHNGLHFLRLALPFVFTHLAFAAKELVIRLSVRPTEAVPQRRELTVVVVEVQVVHGMACCAVDDRGIGNVFAIVLEPT